MYTVAEMFSCYTVHGYDTQMLGHRDANLYVLVQIKIGAIMHRQILSGLSVALTLHSAGSDRP